MSGKTLNWSKTDQIVKYFGLGTITKEGTSRGLFLVQATSLHYKNVLLDCM